MYEFATYPKKWGNMTPRHVLDTIKAVGFTSICLNGDIFTDKQNITIDEYYRTGLRFENAHLECHGTSDMWKEGINGDAVCEKYVEQMSKCREYGIKIGVAHVTWGLGEVSPPSQMGLDRFRRVVDAAEKNDIVIAFENSVYPGHLRYVLDNIDSPSAMFCFDSGHRNAFCPEENFFPDYADRLATMHLQDNDGARDLHVCPFDGTIDWGKTVSDIKDTKAFQRCITFEIGGGRPSKDPGVNAKEIYSKIAHMPISKQPQLYEIKDGSIEFYGKLTYEEYLLRQMEAIKKIVAMAGV